MATASDHSFAYAPAGQPHALASPSGAVLAVFERLYQPGYGTDDVPEAVVGSTDEQPVVAVPGEVFVLRKLLPTGPAYDFNIHIMDFEPGEYLNVKEVHYNQHGLLLLEGRGIYRLDNQWYPVQAGDVIWMAPFVPQCHVIGSGHLASVRHWKPSDALCLFHLMPVPRHRYAALGATRSRYLLYKDTNRDPLHRT
eukprot:SM000003S11119  [mRNA]  locus=s3:992234:994091:- [translate_table: standard]